MKPRSASCTVPSWSSENESISFTCTNTAHHTLRALGTMPGADQQRPSNPAATGGSALSNRAGRPVRANQQHPANQHRGGWELGRTVPRRRCSSTAESKQYRALQLVSSTKRRLKSGFARNWKLLMSSTAHSQPPRRARSDSDATDPTIRDPCGCGAYRILRGSACRRRR